MKINKTRALNVYNTDLAQMRLILCIEINYLKKYKNDILKCLC